MKPQNIVEGALPAIAAVFVLISAFWNSTLSFTVSLVSLTVLSLYLFIRRDWGG